MCESLRNPAACAAKVNASKQTRFDVPWYAHFFRGRELVVVYPDNVFHTGLRPDTWAAVITHGARRGIPRAQIDFAPRTLTDAANEFTIDLTSV